MKTLTILLYELNIIQLNPSDLPLLRRNTLSLQKPKVSCRMKEGYEVATNVDLSAVRISGRLRGRDQAERMDKLLGAFLSVPYSAVLNDTANREGLRKKTGNTVRMNKVPDE